LVLDTLDHAILKAVQRDNQITHQALGKRIGLSASSCRRRLAAMRKAGVIVADVSIVDPHKIGLAVTLYVLVTLERDAASVHRAFRSLVSATPEIVSCAYVTGPADYLATICVSGIAAYEELADRVFNGPPVKRVETMVEMRPIKRF
jgi:Lrp/AsnC family leucine-responsive transcriptional regulator